VVDVAKIWCTPRLGSVNRAVGRHADQSESLVAIIQCAQTAISTMLVALSVKGSIFSANRTRVLLR
jgi:hypothetical protein